MATAEKVQRRIVQQPIKSTEPPGCIIRLPTHIQESKKLIKRNGETVEIVTLTLTTTPKVGQENRIITTFDNITDHNLEQRLQSGSVGEAVVPHFGHEDIVSSTAVVVDDNQPAGSSPQEDDGNTTQKLLILDQDADSETLLISEPSMVPPTSSADDFVIITSAPSNLSTDGSQSQHQNLTFITADNSSSNDIITASNHETTSSHEIVAISSAANDDISGRTAPTAGMTSQNMSLVHMVDTTGLAVQNADTAVTPRPLSGTLVDEYSHCLICGDKGSGFHYSVFSCEGCKGFFKRSVQKNLTYTCKNDGTCDINRFSRNSCQYCRFRKCLQFGMKKEGVRDDRTPGGLTRGKFKRMRLPEHDDIATSESKQSQYQLESDIQLLVNCDPYISPSFVSTEEKTATLYGAFQLTAILYDDLIYIVKWAKQVLGFKTLEYEDQKRLLESSLAELSLLRLAYRSLASEEKKLRFAHDIELTLGESQQLGFDPDYIDAVLELIGRLKDLEIDDKEYAILCAIVLFYEDTVGLRDTITVLKMQQKYLTILQRYIRLVYGGDLKRYGRMLLRLPALRTIAMRIDEVFLQFIVSDRLSVSHMIDSALNDDVDDAIDSMVMIDESGIITSADVEETVANCDIVTTENVVEHVSIG